MGKEIEEGMETIKMSDPKLMKILEVAIRTGRWVLIEKVPISLDPALEPILQ